MKTEIQHLPIQVKALAPYLREKDPDLWKCNTLQECIDRIQQRPLKFMRDSTQWVIEFKEGSIAGEFSV